MNKLSRVFFKTIVIAGLLIFGGWLILHLLYVSWFGRIDASVALLSQPSSYRPAAIAMARLCDTDPKLLVANMNALPPDWTPTEIGRLGPLELNVDADDAWMSTTSGLAEFNGYRVERDKQKSTDTTTVWNFSAEGMKSLGRVQPYSFSLPAHDGYSESEVVRKGMAELSRRQIARANRTDPTVSYDANDPIADRRRLLAQHPGMAKALVSPDFSAAIFAATTHP